MSRHAVGDGVQEYGAVAFKQNRFFARDCVRNGERIVAVYALGVHVLRIDARADPRDITVAHRFAAGLSAHTVKVVEKVKQNRRRAPGRFGPQRFVLVHCGHHHCFPYRTAAQGRVSHIRNDNAAFFIDAFEKRGSRRYVGRTAYDCVIRH